MLKVMAAILDTDLRAWVMAQYFIASDRGLIAYDGVKCAVKPEKDLCKRRSMKMILFPHLEIKDMLLGA